MTLAEGDGSARYTLAALTGRTCLEQSTVRSVIGRLVAAGWVDAAPPPGPVKGRAGRAFGLAPGRLGAAREALADARARVARAARGLTPGPAAPAGLGSRVTGPGVAAAQLASAFLGAPGQPRYHSELSARTGIPPSTARRVLERMKAAGWVADAPAETQRGARPRGRPPRGLVLTPAGEAAAPEILAAARIRLSGISQDLDAGGPAPDPLGEPRGRGRHQGGRAPSPGRCRGDGRARPGPGRLPGPWPLVRTVPRPAGRGRSRPQGRRAAGRSR